ncbi:MAG: hypothetical protein JWO80_6109, partial [Bryobacterales bacterium]|nr:hypothetical protein [Bryobacterales bacterium]
MNPKPGSSLLPACLVLSSVLQAASTPATSLLVLSKG